MAGTIRVLIDKQGGTQISVDGLKGPACLEATRDLEAALGVVDEKAMTAEMYDTGVACELKLDQEG